MPDRLAAVIACQQTGRVTHQLLTLNDRLIRVKRAADQLFV
jgi:hypothetical protein